MHPSGSLIKKDDFHLEVSSGLGWSRTTTTWSTVETCPFCGYAKIHVCALAITRYSSMTLETLKVFDFERTSLPGGGVMLTVKMSDHMNTRFTNTLLPSKDIGKLQRLVITLVAKPEQSNPPEKKRAVEPEPFTFASRDWQSYPGSASYDEYWEGYLGHWPGGKGRYGF